jgi:hypothetical protein
MYVGISTRCGDFNARKDLTIRLIFCGRKDFTIRLIFIGRKDFTIRLIFTGRKDFAIRLIFTGGKHLYIYKCSPISNWRNCFRPLGLRLFPVVMITCCIL